MKRSREPRKLSVRFRNVSYDHVSKSVIRITFCLLSCFRIKSIPNFSQARCSIHPHANTLLLEFGIFLLKSCRNRNLQTPNLFSPKRFFHQRRLLKYKKKSLTFPKDILKPFHFDQNLLLRKTAFSFIHQQIEINKLAVKQAQGSCT